MTTDLKLFLKWLSVRLKQSHRLITLASDSDIQHNQKNAHRRLRRALLSCLKQVENAYHNVPTLQRHLEGIHEEISQLCSPQAVRKPCRQNSSVVRIPWGLKRRTRIRVWKHQMDALQKSGVGVVSKMKERMTEQLFVASLISRSIGEREEYDSIKKYVTNANRGGNHKINERVSRFRRTHTEAEQYAVVEKYFGEFRLENWRKDHPNKLPEVSKVGVTFLEKRDRELVAKVFRDSLCSRRSTKLP